MKKYGIIAALVVVIAAVVLGVKLLGGGKDVATSLPQELTMVGRFDFKALALQYGIDAKDAAGLLAKKLFSSSQDESGVDYLQPSYVFASQGYFGAIVPLDDTKRFEEFIEKSGSQPFESQRGLRWTLVGKDNVLLAVAEDRAMMMGPAVGSELDALRGTIADCLKQSEGESGKQSPLFGMLETRKEPVALATTFDALPKQFLPEALHKEFDVTKIRALAGLSFTKSKVGLALTLESDDEKTNKLLNQMDEALQPINGSLLQTAPKRPTGHVEMGVDGEKLLELLRSFPQIRTKLLLANTVFDADLIVKSIKGDMALSVKYDMLMNSDGGLIQAQLKDERFLKNISGWNDEYARMAGVVFTTYDQTSGEVRKEGSSPVFYAVRNHVLRLSEDKGTANANGYEDVAYKWMDEMKANKLYGTIDASQILMLKMYLPNLDRITLKMPEARQLNLELTAKEGKELIKF